MECCICKVSTRESTRPPETICDRCEAGAHCIIDLISCFETDNGNAKASTSTHSPSNSRQSLFDTTESVFRLIKKVKFFHEMVNPYRNQTPTDILLKPGNNEPAIAAHRGLLAVRSEIFKIMLELDTCKAPLLQEAITLPELNHEELEALLEFLYSGSLPQQKIEKHIYPLSLAAHKYEIIYLQSFCQKYMLESIHSGNALLVLEISDFCSFIELKQDTLCFIVKHKRDIVFSAEYEVFAAKNPSLSVQITRAILKEA